jgi:hypothetical protein
LHCLHEESPKKKNKPKLLAHVAPLSAPVGLGIEQALCQQAGRRDNGMICDDKFVGDSAI